MLLLSYTRSTKANGEKNENENKIKLRVQQWNLILQDGLAVYFRDRDTTIFYNTENTFVFNHENSLFMILLYMLL